MSDTIQKIADEMRALAGHYHRNACIVRELSAFADRIEQSLSAGASGGGDWTALDRVYNFLMGIADLDGVSFGEDHPKVAAGRYWWRHDLAAAYVAARKPAPASPATGAIGIASIPPGGDGATTRALFDARTVPAGTMLYATPQPESARGEWQEAVVEACMRIEGGYKANDPRATLRAIEEWWYQLGVETTADGILGSKALAAAPQPQQAPAQADDAAEQYRQAHNAGEAHGRVMAALEAATPPAHGDGEGDWYTDADTGSHHVDWDSNPARQISVILKKDGKVGWAAYIDGERLHGPDAMAPEFMEALQKLTARPAPEADARDAQNAKRYLWLRDDASRAQLEIFADRRGTRLAADRVCDAGIAMSLPAQEGNSNG